MSRTAHSQTPALIHRATWGLLGLNGAMAAVSVGGALALEACQHVPDWNYERLSSALAVLNIVVGAGVALLDMATHDGSRATLLLLGLSVAVAGGAELVGASTGLPFGDYEYTGKLGPQLSGSVPYIIPLAWFMIAYASVSTSAALGRQRWVAALFAAGMATSWDVALDPAMTAGSPAWIWLEDGPFYGIPLSNYVAWFGVALAIAWLYLRAADPPARRSVRVPWALYAVQSCFPAGLAAVYGRGWATLAWAVCLVAVASTWALLRRPQTGADWSAQPHLPVSKR